MPSTFMDGPAAGAGLNLRRAPLFLRVVIDQTDGTVDALNELDDTPGPDELIHVYRMLPGSLGRAHVCVRGRNRGASGWYEWGIYKHVPDVDGEALRETERWRAWVREQVDADPALAAHVVEPVER